MSSTLEKNLPASSILYYISWYFFFPSVNGLYNLVMSCNNSIYSGWPYHFPELPSKNSNKETLETMI